MGPARFHCATLLLVTQPRPPHAVYGERRSATGGLKRQLQQKNATAGNRTRINCLEGNYANHYTTVAP